MVVLSHPEEQMSEALKLFTPNYAPAVYTIDPQCLEVRHRYFPDKRITFYAPGLKRYKTADYSCHNHLEFVSISVTGDSCALNCEHCQTKMLHSMLSLPDFKGNLWEMGNKLAGQGARGVLISGGSDKNGRVPLLKHIPDMIRLRRELNMTIRVHPGIPDEETCAALAEVDVDGVMLDIIGDQETINDVYHLDVTPKAYDDVLDRLQRNGVPTIPHIILGHYFGKMNGEWQALEIIRKYNPKTLVLVIMTPLSGTPMMGIKLPSLDEIGRFFEEVRMAMPRTPVILGCARPLGPIKAEIDKLAISAGLNGIAYPAEGMVEQAQAQGLQAGFINACCGVTW